MLLQEYQRYSRDVIWVAVVLRYQKHLEQNHGLHLYMTADVKRLLPQSPSCPSSSSPDNIDDPTGNFRGTPLTGWKVFLLLLCALLGIVVCAVVGAVVFQKRQERNKRFY